MSRKKKNHDQNSPLLKSTGKSTQFNKLCVQACVLMRDRIKQTDTHTHRNRETERQRGRETHTERHRENINLFHAPANAISWGQTISIILSSTLKILRFWSQIEKTQTLFTMYIEVSIKGNCSALFNPIVQTLQFILHSTLEYQYVILSVYLSSFFN